MTRSQALTVLDALLRRLTGTTHGTTPKASGGESSPLSGVGWLDNQDFENGTGTPPASGAEEIADARNFEKRLKRDEQFHSEGG